MRIWSYFYQVFLRFRYPVSLPEDIADALGISFSNAITFEEFLHQLSHPRSPPTKLQKFMPRQQAEEAFSQALKKEHFTHNSLFSYYFYEGWLEFSLLFDSNERLRRIYVQHQYILESGGVEIPLNKPTNRNEITL